MTTTDAANPNAPTAPRPLDDTGPIDLLVVFAHPDDEAAWFGGMLPYYAARGRDVAGLCMTRGGGGGNTQRREQELRASLRTCGVQREPLWGDFADCGYIAPGQFQTTDWVWQRWGGREAARDWMADAYRKLRPAVVMAHNPWSGDYGHPNHMTAGWACLDAFDRMNDADDPACPKKVYITSRAPEAWRVDWDAPGSGPNGRTAGQVAQDALACHQSQSVSKSTLRPYLAFELARTRVGDDRQRVDVFENC